MEDETFRIVRVAPSGEEPPVLRFFGTIDEHADLGALAELHDRVRFDLGELRRMNSFGVRTWMVAVSTMPEDARVELANCPPMFMDHVSMLANFIGPARIVSFRAPYICDACDVETDLLHEVSDCVDGGPPALAPCPSCGEPLEPDYIDEVYLRFLREPP